MLTLQVVYATLLIIVLFYSSSALVRGVDEGFSKWETVDMLVASAGIFAALPLLAFVVISLKEYFSS